MSGNFISFLLFIIVLNFASCGKSPSQETSAAAPQIPPPPVSPSIPEYRPKTFMLFEQGSALLQTGYFSIYPQKLRGAVLILPDYANLSPLPDYQAHCGYLPARAPNTSDYYKKYIEPFGQLKTHPDPYTANWTIIDFTDPGSRNTCMLYLSQLTTYGQRTIFIDSLHATVPGLDLFCTEAQLKGYKLIRSLGGYNGSFGTSLNDPRRLEKKWMAQGDEGLSTPDFWKAIQKNPKGIIYIVMADQLHAQTDQEKLNQEISLIALQSHAEARGKHVWLSYSTDPAWRIDAFTPQIISHDYGRLTAIASNVSSFSGMNVQLGLMTITERTKSIAIHNSNNFSIRINVPQTSNFKVFKIGGRIINAPIDIVIPPNDFYVILK